jgi:hypothetical protein
MADRKLKMSEIEQKLESVAEAAFEHECQFERFGPSNFWMRFLVFLNDLSLYFLRRSLPGARRAQSAIGPLLRLHREQSINRPDILSFIKQSALELSAIPDSLPAMPWAKEILPPEANEIPNMLEIDAMRYYVWLGRTLGPGGAVVEIGSWMGGSTACLISGLRLNLRISEPKLHVFDSFIWRNWMCQFATAQVLRARYQEGDSFTDSFFENCAPFQELLEVTRCELWSKSADSGLPPPRWDRGPISAIVIDHSDRYEANASVWALFAQFFIPDKTIVVFNQYGNLRAEELRRFCRDHRRELMPLHHLACSGRAFLFTGRLS